MRELLSFLVRFHAFFLFIALELLCVFLISRTNDFHRANIINSTNFITGGLYNSYNSVTDYLHLKTVNDSLAAENADLRAKLESSYFSNMINSDTNRHLYEDDYELMYTYIDAKVINTSTNRANNFIYINRGSNHGIQAEMGLISMNGVAGIIREVSPNYAVAMSLLHRDCRISAKLKKDGYYGNVNWDGKRSTEAKMTEVPKHVKVAVGDTVVSSGNSNFFPPDIMVGTVKSVEPIEGVNFLDITIDLSTNFDNLSYVYVVNFMMKEELEQLQAEVEGE